MKNPKAFCLQVLLLILLHHDLKGTTPLEIMSDSDNSTTGEKIFDTMPKMEADEKPLRSTENMGKHNTSYQYGSQDIAIDNPFGKLMPIFFNFKQPSKKNGSMGSSLEDNGIPILPIRDIKYNEVSDDKRQFSEKLPHKSILISKLNDVDQNYNTIPRRQPNFRPDPVFFLDPMFDFLDRMMDSLMKPILNRPNKLPAEEKTRVGEPLQFGDDSSLKSWIQIENMYTTKPKSLNVKKVKAALNNQDTDEVATDDSTLNEDYPDYKNDLRKKFRENRSDSENIKSNIKVDQCSDSSNIESEWEKSENELANEKLTKINIHKNKDESKINNEDSWWYRLLFPGKPKILRDHTKSSVGFQGNELRVYTLDRKPEDNLLMNDRPNLAVGGDMNSNEILKSEAAIQSKANKSKTAKSRIMKAMYNNYDIILESIIIGFLLSILLLVLKISVLFYREYNLSRIIGQYDYYKITLPMLRPMQKTRRAAWARTSPPPSYSYQVAIPDSSAIPREQ